MHVQFLQGRVVKAARSHLLAAHMDSAAMSKVYATSMALGHAWVATHEISKSISYAPGMYGLSTPQDTPAQWAYRL